MSKAWIRIALLLIGSPAYADLLPVEAYGALPLVGDVSISPDGTRIAMARNEKDGAQIAYVMELATGKLIRAVTVRQVQRMSEQPQLRGINFATNRHLVYLLQATFGQLRGVPAEALTPGRSRIDYWRSAILDVDTGKSVLISRKESLDWGLQFIELVSPVAGDPSIGRMRIRSSPYQDGMLNVYDVDLESGRTRLHQRGRRATRRFEFDSAGAPVARLDVDDRANVWSLYSIADGAERLVASDRSETGYSGFAGMTADGRYVFLDTMADNPRETLFTRHPDNPVREVLLQHPDLDVGAVLTDVWHNTLVGGVIVEHYPEQHYFDPELRQVHAMLKTMWPDALVEISTWSADRKKFVIYLEAGGDAGGYYLFEPATRKVTLLAMRYPDVVGNAVGVRMGIAFPARDGTRIPAYLTYPAGAEAAVDAKPLPAVVLVHGGPVARDTLAFDWWASFLASRGYLVVQPNYRGSAGYGRAWELAGRGEWGRLMQDDVEDAVHALVRSGKADPQRICIVGASYGGYATLVGATKTPGLFRCAASIAGVSDLPRMLELTRLAGGRHGAALDWWTLLMGDPDTDRASLAAASPAQQAHKALAPVLLMHGENDTVVPIEQSERMAAALRAAGKPVEFIRLPGEDHWLSDAPSRIRMLRELERFLGTHLGNRQAGLHGAEPDAGRDRGKDADQNRGQSRGQNRGMQAGIERERS